MDYQGKRVAEPQRRRQKLLVGRQLKSMLIFFVCAGLATIYAAGATPREKPLPTAPTEEVQEPAEEAVTLETIRAAATFRDIPAEDPYYDTVCYVTFYDLMKPAADGSFSPFAPATQADAAAAAEALGGDAAMLPEGTDFVSRRQLAKMLYAAKHPAPEKETAPEGEPAVPVLTESGETELRWAAENGLFRTLVQTGEDMQPEIAVSRIQMAAGLISLQAMDEEDALAAEICAALPEGGVDSAARANHESIQAAVDAAAQKYGATGLQVAVIENGTVTDTYAYGWATRNQEAMTADHKMRIASISKVVVGITAQLLREDGIIDLDQDISRYWNCTVKNPQHPDLPITIRNMLSHTSSIINAGDNVSRAYESVRAQLQSGGYSGAVPGDIGYWSYNNYAFSVLGMTLELAADRCVDDILEEKLYRAMDIDASYAAGDIAQTDKLVTLYRQGGEVSRSVDTQKSIHGSNTPGANGTYFAGGLTISARDLGKLIALLASDGCYEGVQLLEAESVDMMETRYEQPVPGGSYQALPLRYWPALYGREGVYYHTGSAYGVFNCASYDPLTGDGVVVLSVGASGAKDDYGIYRVCAEINDYIYGVLQ